MDIPDPNEIIEGIKQGYAAFKSMRDFIPKLPTPKDREEATKAADDAELALKLANATIALKFNYPLCQRHFPPGIRLSIGHPDDDPYSEQFRCQECGHEWPGKEPPPEEMTMNG